MIEIIKAGTKKRVTCPTCGAVLSYDESTDVLKRGSDPLVMHGCFAVAQEYINCPCCKQDIILKSTR